MKHFLENNLIDFCLIAGCHVIIGFKLWFLTLLGLSIDFAANKLYWISSANGTINRCNLDGGGLEVLETLKRELARGTALAVMGEWSLS